MYKKTKVLLIAPYEGLKEAVLGVLPQYQDKLELTMSLGDLTSGVQQAQTAQTQGYDVIISRGGTAELIARNVPLPVINIEISGYDYLRAIKLAENIRGRKAFVGFPYITARARSVNELLCTNVDIFTIHTAEEIAPLLKKLASEGYELIIGDVATCREAEELDISNLLLTSGEESLANAFDRAVALSEAFRRSTEQARLLQAIMQQAGERVVVLDASGSIAYQTVELGSYALGVTDLEEFSHEAAAGREREVIVPRDEADLCVRVRQLELAGEPGYRAFYFRRLAAGRQRRNDGISIRNFRASPANKDFMRQNSVHDPNTLQVAHSFCASMQPVLFTGDAGVGRLDMAVSVHRYSERWMYPFIHIDCTRVHFGEMLAWLRQVDSSLYAGATVCFEHLDALEKKGQKQLAELLEEMNPRIWRFIATAQPSISQQAADGMFDERLYRFFSKLSLYIPNLSQSDQDIRKIINLYIIEANARLGRQVVGMDEDAVALIENHPWQYNFSELQNTIYQIMLSAEGPILHHMDVERVLRARDAVHTDSGVATTGTLEEIELRIIEKVLEEENGNVSRAAARLNIGRSTLWRKLKEKNRAE